MKFAQKAIKIWSDADKIDSNRFTFMKYSQGLWGAPRGFTAMFNWHIIFVCSGRVLEWPAVIAM